MTEHAPPNHDDPEDAQAGSAPSSAVGSEPAQVVDSRAALARAAIRRRLPILARHAISLSVVFVLAILGSYFVGQRIHRSMQLDKLTASEQAVFDQGMQYTLRQASTDEVVLREALAATETIEQQRAADLMLVIVMAHQQTDAPLPTAVTEAIGPLIERLSIDQAFGLHDALDKQDAFEEGWLSRILLQHFHAADDEALERAVNLADERLIWGKDKVPMARWVRWLELLSKQGSQATQEKAARMLGELPEVLNDGRIAGSLARLSESSHASVRDLALRSCAGYAAIAMDPTPFEQVIYVLGRDEDPAIAQKAWLVVGHLNPFSGSAADWRHADLKVSAAMLWASAKTNPDQPKPALLAYEQQQHRLGSLLALGELPVDRSKKAYTPAEDLLWQMLRAPFSNNRKGLDADAKALWRLLCAVSKHEPPVVDLVQAVQLYVLPDQARDASAISLTWKDHEGVLFAAGFFAQDAGTVGADKETIKSYADLAMLEGLARTRTRSFQTKLDFPPAWRVIARAAGLEIEVSLDEVADALAADPGLTTLCVTALSQYTSKEALQKYIGELIRSPHEDLRAVGILLEAIHSTRPTFIDGLNAQLLRERPDLTTEQLHAMSDEELAAIGLRRIDALGAMLRAAEVAEATSITSAREKEVRLLRLALWTRGDRGDSYTPVAEELLLNQQLPVQTVLMCLLHQKRPAALAYLLTERSGPRTDLGALFVQKRFWHVFKQSVDTSHLTLWLWGDAEAQAFQFEAMRQWYAVNRWKLERGWWPEPEPRVYD